MGMKLLERREIGLSGGLAKGESGNYSFLRFCVLIYSLAEKKTLSAF